MFSTCGEYHQKLRELAEKERLARESEAHQAALQAKKKIYSMLVRMEMPN